MITLIGKVQELEAEREAMVQEKEVLPDPNNNPYNLNYNPKHPNNNH